MEILLNSLKNPIVIWTIAGVIITIVFRLVISQPVKGGIVVAIWLGIVGAILGGFSSAMLLGLSISSFDIGSFIFAIVGSLVLLFIQLLLMRDTQQFRTKEG